MMKPQPPMCGYLYEVTHDGFPAFVRIHARSDKDAEKKIAAKCEKDELTLLGLRKKAQLEPDMRVQGGQL